MREVSNKEPSSVCWVSLAYRKPPIWQRVETYRAGIISVEVLDIRDMFTRDNEKLPPVSRWRKIRKDDVNL